jgi:2-polyprenyl-6-methoxyphenol hydroxylase-like FAD-dependent oxidoreductase
MRNPTAQPLLHPVQPRPTRVEDWSDDAFWTGTEAPHPRRSGRRARHRPVDREIHRAAAVLRGEPMRWGRLFLCGDAAHIVPPTGAKGLNLAASDVHYLFEGLTEYYETGSIGRDRRLFRASAGAASGRRAVFMVVHLADAPLSRIRRASTGGCSGRRSSF